jgi:CRISPR-associated endoribonuclease Cas6
LITSTPPEDQIRLHFASPTAFKSHGKQIIIPLSDFVFRSLLRKWNKFASLKFDEAVKNYVNHHMAIKQYELHSRSIQYREKGYRFGGLGFVTYELLKDDRYWMAVLHVLAQYALFAGVGRGTTMGFGQCQKFSREQIGNDNNN